MNKTDCEAKVKAFFVVEGITNLTYSSSCPDCGSKLEDGHCSFCEKDWELSDEACPYCGAFLGGGKLGFAKGWNPETRKYQKYEVSFEPVICMRIKRIK